MLAFVGAGLIGNWQAIGHKDPCSNYNEQNVTVTLSSNTSLHQQWCETLRNSSHQCFWNQQSHITGEFCNTCREKCLSKHTNINFYQFTIGILLIASVTRLVFVLVSAITSDIAPVTSQVYYYNIMVTAGSYITYTPHQYSTQLYHIKPYPISVHFQIYTCYVWKFIFLTADVYNI